MRQILVNALSNRHTSVAGLIYGLSKFGCPILTTWFPDHHIQIEQTAAYLEGAAVFYGLAAAGDASNVRPIDTTPKPSDLPKP